MAKEEREVIYPDPRVDICADAGIGPLTGQQAKELLGWETEPDYKARMEVEITKGTVKKGTKQAAGFGEEFTIKNAAGMKVRCSNNTNNRPFDENHARALAQDILNRAWKLNFENIIISITGLILSGQHRLIGLVIACERWSAEQARWKKNWPEEPTIETLVAFGASEDPEVLQTLDNVKTRTLSDVFYTSPLFANLKSQERKECSRYMDNAVDLLWTRTGAGEKEGDHKTYQTHSSSVDFADRHGKLKECVKHIFEQNKERAISLLKLSAGHCAALMYLQGSAATDKAKYDQNRSEKSIDWQYLDKAKNFWALLAAHDKAMLPIIAKLGQLVDPDAEEGLGGRVTEKLGVIIRAWNLFAGGKKITEDELELEYGDDENGNLILLECPLVGGIDVGMKVKQVDDDPTPEEIEAEKEKIKAERAKEMAEKVAASKPAQTPALVQPKPVPPPLPTPKPASPALSGGTGRVPPVDAKPAPKNGVQKAPAPKPKAVK